MTNSAGVTAVEAEAAALVVLARMNIPPDIQELLVRGNPERSIPPGALRAAIAAALPPPEAAGARRETWEQEQSRIHSIAFDAVAEVLDLHAPELDDKARILIMTSAACRMVLHLATKHPPAPSAPPPHSQASEVVETMLALAALPLANVASCYDDELDDDSLSVGPFPLKYFRALRSALRDAALSRQAPQPAE